MGPTGDDPDRFAPGSRLLMRREPAREMQDRPESAVRERGTRSSFEGIDSIEEARDLRGVDLADRGRIAPAPPGRDLLPFPGDGADGGRRGPAPVLGRIESIMQTGSNDVYCVRQGPEEILIPAVKEFVERVDLESGRICG